MKNTIDRRVQYTKMILQGSLLNLLDTKAMDKITVTEICKVADINRNTFYYHYDTVYDILTELETQMFDLIVEKFKKASDVRQIIITACSILENNKRMSRLVFRDPRNILINKVVSSFKAMNKDHVEDNKIFKFGENGAIGVLRDWVTTGFREPAESIAEFIFEMIERVKKTEPYG